FHSHTTFAQHPTKTSVCEYQEKRKHIPINPKTNKPYTLDERNEEPFVKASISKKQIKQCLQAQRFINHHHILFEDYRDAWQELAKETGKYDIPLGIEGGVLHAETHLSGGIGLYAFADSTITDVSQLTEKEGTSWRIMASKSSIVTCTAWNQRICGSA